MIVGWHDFVAIPFCVARHHHLRELQRAGAAQGVPAHPRPRDRTQLWLAARLSRRLPTRQVYLSVLGGREHTGTDCRPDKCTVSSARLRAYSYVGCCGLVGRVAGPAFHCNADLDPAFHWMGIRILLLIRVMRICDHCWSTDLPRLHFWASTPRPWASTALYGSILSFFKLLNFELMRIKIQLFPSVLLVREQSYVGCGKCCGSE